MSIRIAITHRIEQRFPRRLILPTHWLRLHPAPPTKAKISAWSLHVEPEPHFLNWVRDPYENHLARLDLPEPVAELRLVMDLIAELTPINPFDFLTEPYAYEYPFEYPEQLRKELGPYLHLPPLASRLKDYLGRIEPGSGNMVDRLSRVNRETYESLTICGSTRPGPVDLERVLERRQASPWEAAWLLTLALRHLGLAARFTAGYRVLLTAAAEGTGTDACGSFLPDRVELIGWSEVFLPGAGWIGLDPGLGLFTHEGYIPLAATPDPLSAVPWVMETLSPEELKAYPDGSQPTPIGIDERLTVRRLEPSIPEQPYRAAQWADLTAFGSLVDRRLRGENLWLAIGPTVSFTSGDVTAPEWHSVALGPAKRSAAERLLIALRQRLAPGGVPQESQGEWFSGESLPRWRLGCFYRADGQPIWRDPSWLALLRPYSGRAGDAGAENHDIAEAAAFAHSLARRLGVPAERVIPAHEDQLYELWQNRNHIHLDPPGPALHDPERRQDLAIRLSQTGLEPVGFVLPLRWDRAREAWSSGVWPFRRGGLHLVPGTSPMGFRLPLESLPVGEAEVSAPDPERCPFEERPLLSEIFGEASTRLTRYLPMPAAPEPADPDAPSTAAPRTAVCIELRAGRLAVFLPPLTHLEHWLDLVAAIEDVAADLHTPVLLEGYDPPEDFRLRRLSLEPDAGVLRLALPLAETFAELRHVVETAYQEAQAIGLSAERVGSDGRRQPPGGDCEIVLGGGQPALSPFLLRPQLLHSLIAYWQRHPCLSYFFAGRMVGPSGPAPRPDEGRDDALYELGLALSRLPLDSSPGPWLPDRALRHLLADPAGDIHKAEIRIDQLYGPDRSSQRQGRIAVGSFETAPNARQELAQTLLLSALVAFLAQRPGDSELVDLGAQLHDRFMLPEALWEDLATVLADLRDAGFPIQAEWFEPFLEQRFPLIGRVQIGTVGLELRYAHEPWPVLAEEVVGGAVTRFIDSANQRLQVIATGFVPAGQILLCNGKRVPLQPQRTRGRCLAGVRYKVWNPPSTLHPTVPPVASLIFDLVDARSGEVLGGCTWVPTRPGLVGPLATPVQSGRPEPGLGRSWQRRTAALPVVAWGSEGRFLRFGSGARRVPLAAEWLRPPPRQSYLLDLTQPD